MRWLCCVVWTHLLVFTVVFFHMVNLISSAYLQCKLSSELRTLLCTCTEVGTYTYAFRICNSIDFLEKKKILNIRRRLRTRRRAISLGVDRVIMLWGSLLDVAMVGMVVTGGTVGETVGCKIKPIKMRTFKLEIYGRAVILLLLPMKLNEKHVEILNVLPFTVSKYHLAFLRNGCNNVLKVKSNSGCAWLHYITFLMLYPKLWIIKSVICY